MLFPSRTAARQGISGRKPLPMPENDHAMPTLTEHAPAKLNLSLRVLGKRADGFHEIETLMVALPGLADRVSLEPADEFGFECDAEGVPSDERNLAVKAVRVFEEMTGTRVAGRLRLEKRIPHGAGLGGGSSDAAAVLRLLAKRHGEAAEAAQMHELAARLGSDVPFFLRGGAAWCRGRGERIEPADAPPPLRLLLLKPWFGVDTPDAYRRWKDAEPLPDKRMAPRPSGSRGRADERLGLHRLRRAAPRSRRRRTRRRRPPGSGFRPVVVGGVTGPPKAEGNQKLSDSFWGTSNAD